LCAWQCLCQIATNMSIDMVNVNIILYAKCYILYKYHCHRPVEHTSLNEKVNRSLA